MTDARDPQTYAILGACMEVHSKLGPGFLEAVYQAASSGSWGSARISFAREVSLPVHYKGEVLDCSYKADFICYGSVIVELKALKTLTNVEHAQVINYLKATGFQRGLLVNFGPPTLEYKRFVRSADHSDLPLEDES